MNTIRITGWGAVSPAGWGVAALRQVCEDTLACPTSALEHPGCEHPIAIRRVPRPSPRPAFLAHPRLRRSSAISIHATAAALEALGSELAPIQAGRKRLGIVFTSMTGCVAYSRRFYAEVLKDPSTASPIVFPETVFNAPASHLATYLNSTGINYTLIGDPGTFLQGVAMAAEWLLEHRVDACLVLGAEELDWLVAGAQHLFNSRVIACEGAGALLLERNQASQSGIRLDGVTHPVLFTRQTPRKVAARRVREAIDGGTPQTLLFDSLTGVESLDLAESGAWQGWRGGRISVKRALGESFAAGSAWQSVLAADHLAREEPASAIVNVVGCNQQAIAARFSRHPAGAS